MRTKKTRTYIPPAFYDRDGSFVQPPTFEMPAFTRKISTFPGLQKDWLAFEPGMVANGKQLG